VPLVAVDEDESGGTGSPLVVTASWGYLRLRRTHYDTEALQRWAFGISGQPWSQAYVFLKHEEGSPAGPAAAEELQAMVRNPP
jgi:hypothetical protein